MPYKIKPGMLATAKTCFGNKSLYGLFIVLSCTVIIFFFCTFNIKISDILKKVSDASRTQAEYTIVSFGQRHMLQNKDVTMRPRSSKASAKTQVAETLPLSPSSPVLVDPSLWAYRRKDPISNTEQGSKKKYYIFWYNRPKWIDMKVMAKMQHCHYNNCQLTETPGLLNQSSAVIFCVVCSGMPAVPPVRPSDRSPNQSWIFYTQESPVNIPKLSQLYQKTEWLNTWNWTMTYNLDADIPNPYGVLKSLPSTLERNYTDIFQRKKRLAAWFVSRCNRESLRDQFVRKLEDYGFRVDIYGRCGKELKGDPIAILNNDYKFYLSFENSMCKDYVSEKFFKRYQQDIILITRGGANYSRLLPEETFIDTNRFRSFKSLVNYLLQVSENERLYTDILKKKDRYKSVFYHHYNDPYCYLCAKLNNLEENRRMYVNISSYIFNNTCYTPTDISEMDKDDETEFESWGEDYLMLS